MFNLLSFAAAVVVVLRGRFDSDVAALGFVWDDVLRGSFVSDVAFDEREVVRGRLRKVCPPFFGQLFNKATRVVFNL